ncbi:hypothetical protein ACP4OV_014858 [Aristida adscensionis]
MSNKGAYSLLLRSPYLLLALSCLPNAATSLSFGYNLSTPGVLAGADLKYMADAAAADGRINLTADAALGRRHRRSRQLHLQLHGQQGDGMAFFVVPYPASMPQDALGGFLGLLDTALDGIPPTVGVEFDTFRNLGWDPSGTVNHVGVDANDIRSAAYAALPDAAFDGGAVSAWVRYDAGEGTLSASLRFDGRPGLGLYNVSAKVDLRRAGLPQNAAVGFSAATGLCVERHEILSWSFESTLASVAVAHNTELVGWCHDAEELLLVYELVTNGSLDTHLYGTRNIFLTWPIRYKIIFGVGSALLYLHEEWEQCVVHRDIKPSNVMLDWSFDVKLGDFGLARLVDHSRGGHTTALAGTMGYMDPECAVTGRASAKSDVYSFGVVVLEVVSGRKPILLQEEDESKVRLVQWVWELHRRGAIMNAADARLLHAGGELRAEEEMERALVVGLWCTHPDYASRPSIRQAMSVLHFEAPLPEVPPEMPLPTYRPLGAAGGDGTTRSSCTSSSASAATAEPVHKSDHGHAGTQPIANLQAAGAAAGK